MEAYKLGEMEKKFAELIWSHAPVSSGQLVTMCESAFDWKKSTTYTMLKRLCQRGIFKNKRGTVITIIDKDAFLTGQGEQFIEESFEGSLPKFLAAFTRTKALSEKDIDELQALIDRHREAE